MPPFAYTKQPNYQLPQEVLLLADYPSENKPNRPWSWLGGLSMSWLEGGYNITTSRNCDWVIRKGCPLFFPLIFRTVCCPTAFEQAGKSSRCHNAARRRQHTNQI